MTPMPPMPPMPPCSTPNDDDARYALFREGSAAEPGLELDARILAAANAELNSSRAKSRRPSNWWRRWLPVSSAITVSVLGVSIALRMLHEDEARQAALLGVMTNEAPVAAMEESVEAAKPAALTDSAGAAAVSSQGLAKKRSAAPPRQKAAVTDTAKTERALEFAPAPMLGESALERSAPALNAPSAKSSESKLAEPNGAADPSTPEAWISELRRLQTAGRLAEARQSLARFRARFPGEVLPDDLAGLQ